MRRVMRRVMRKDSNPLYPVLIEKMLVQEKYSC